MAKGAGGTLGRAIEIVGSLFAAFGGFLYWVAPPMRNGLAFPVGICSLLSLGVLLTMAAVRQRGLPIRARRAWLAACIGLIVLFVLSGASYWFSYDRLVIAKQLPDRDRLIRGTVLLDDVSRDLPAMEAYLGHTLSDRELVDNFGGDNTQEPQVAVWTAGSIRLAELWLLLLYLLMGASLSAAVFCFIVGPLSPMVRQALKAEQGGAGPTEQ